MINVRRRPLVRVSWTLLSLLPSFLVLAYVLGAAAWNGMNFAVGLYIVVSGGGFLGILLGFWAAFSRRRALSWMVTVSAAAIAVLAALFAFSFIFSRHADVPLGEPIFIGRFPLPILSIWAVAFVCGSIEALLYFPTVGKRKGIEGSPNER